MKCVIQCVEQADVTVEGRTTGAIDHGLLVYFGVRKGDTEEDLKWICDKLVKLRLFSDENGKTNLSVKDVGGQILFISQFTLYGSLRKGNRPGYDEAELPARANELYEKGLEYLKKSGIEVASGQFGAHMRVTYTNIGPATYILERD